jgi:CRISPR-associated protein Cas2
MHCWIITYDIADSRRLRRVAKLMEQRGIRVQKSVFECWLDDEQRHALFAQLESVLDKARDSVRWYTICADCRQTAASHGQTEIRENRSYYIV